MMLCSSSCQSHEAIRARASHNFPLIVANGRFFGPLAE
jgi:hypothetical protein